MSQSPDVYRDWLQIPDGPRPPDHYTLLGVAQAETDVGKINSAADARVKIVRPRCLKFPAEGTQLLNEIAQARICLTDPEERIAYDEQLRGTSSQDTQKWARLHATFESDSSAGLNAAAGATPVITPSVPPPERKDSYDLATPLPNAAAVPDQKEGTPASAPAATPGMRWCPHCGTKLLARATFCYSCSLAELTYPEWVDLKCRKCQKRMSAGMVICRHCKQDHSLRNAPPHIPDGVVRNLPYFATDLAREKDPEPVGAPIPDEAEIKGRLDDEDFSEVLDSEVGDVKEKKVRIKSQKRLQEEKRAQREAEEEAERAERSVFVSLWYDLLELNEEFHIFAWAAGAIAVVLLLGIPIWVATADWPASRAAAPAADPVVRGNGEQPNPEEKPDEPAPAVVPVVAADEGDGEADRAYKQAKIALDRETTSPETLIEHRDGLLTLIPQVKERTKFDRLAKALQEEAIKRETEKLRKEIAAANSDEEYQALWSQLNQRGGRSKVLTSERVSQVVDELTQTWYRHHVNVYRTRMQALFDEQAFDEASALKDEALPVELQTKFALSWAGAVDLAYRDGVRAFQTRFSKQIDQRVRKREYLTALEELDENVNTFEAAPEDLQRFVEAKRDSILTVSASSGITGLIRSKDYDQARRLTEILLESPGHEKSAAKYRDILKDLGEWSTQPALDPSEIERKPFKDPPGDYSGQKKLVVSSIPNSKERDYYNTYYRRLWIQHKHHTGYFVLDKEGDKTIVFGLAAAAYQACLIDPPAAAGAKKITITSDCFGTLEEAQLLAPNGKIVDPLESVARRLRE